MKISDILIESSTSDIYALITDAKDRLGDINRTDAMPLDYLNQIAIRFRLYDQDPKPCTVYYEIIPDGAATRDATELKFRKKIISAAIAVSGQRTFNYSSAKTVIQNRGIGKRGIATLTNPTSWKLVGIEHGDIKWHEG